jgi:hypothetical protein
MAKMIKNHNKQDTAPHSLIPQARLHDLRHPHATTLQMSGVALGASFCEVGEHALPAVLLRAG